MKTLLAGIFTLLISLPMYAQTLQVISTSPQNGDAAVALATTISFTFDKDMPDPMQSMYGSYFLVILPEEKVEYGTMSLSDNNRTANFGVTLQADTDYTVFMLNAVALDESTLPQPVVFNFTTKATAGEWDVAGQMGETVTAKSGEEITPRITTREEFIRSQEHKILSELPKLAMKAADAFIQAAEGNDFDFSGTVVFLSAMPLDFDPDQDDEYYDEEDPFSQIIYATTVDLSDDSFLFEYVNDGEYFPFAFDLATMIFGGFPEFIAWYDPDGDGIPQSITVDGGDVTGVNLSILDFRPFTGASGIAKAQAAVSGFGEDLVLYALASDEDIIDWDDTFFKSKKLSSTRNKPVAGSDTGGAIKEPTGKNFFWFYLFYSETNEMAYLTFMAPFGPLFVEELLPDEIDEEVEFNFGTMKPIPSTIIDSDAVIAIAEDAGGRAFREGIDTETVDWAWVEFLGAHLYTEFTPNPDPSIPVFWTIIYGAEYFDFETFQYSTEEWMVFINIETGEVMGQIETSNENDGRQTLPQTIVLDQNYPNPFNPSTVITYQLPQNSDVKLDVFDMLGRKVATLVNGPVSAGTHEIRFNANGLASGIYIYRLQMGSEVVMRRMSLVK